MGFKTVVLFDNDRIHETVRDEKGLAEMIRRHAGSGETTDGNGVKLFEPVYASNNTVYVFVSGSLYEMNSTAPETERLMREKPVVVEEAIRYMKEQIAKLEKARQEKR